jgi:PAS domain S-box-containing protein
MPPPVLPGRAMVPLNAVPIAAVVLDREGRILEANGRFATLCRQSERDLGMQSFGDLIAVEYREQTRSRLDRLFSTPDVEPEEFRARLAPADDRWVDLTATPFGSPPAVYSVLVSVEPVGRVRGRFDRAMFRLGVKPRAWRDDRMHGGTGSVPTPPLGDVVAAASHELRQPLQSIIGWVRIARAGGSPDLLTRALGSIERNAMFVNRIADDLLACTPYVRRAVRTLEAVDLCALVDESLESLRPSAAAASVTLGATRPEGPLIVRGDRAGLHHVMLNLLANAIRATPAGGSVDVQLQIGREVARLIVSDTGHGIAKDQLAELFRPFGQRHDTSRGLGVGLAIVREWVELLGGTIHAQSDGEHRGARFIVTLPLDTADLAV